MKITVVQKTVYGREVYYPADDAARTFAAIANTKQLTQQTLQHIHDLGIHIQIEMPERWIPIQMANNPADVFGSTEK